MLDGVACGGRNSDRNHARLGLISLRNRPANLSVQWTPAYERVLETIRHASKVRPPGGIRFNDNVRIDDERAYVCPFLPRSLGKAVATIIEQ